MRNIKKEKNLTKFKSSYVRIIALGFIFMILIGTLLLMLPQASRRGESTAFLDALFTATSATCVSGLVVVDTYTHWSLFGQLIILIMIQIGGLGFITVGVYMAILMNKRIGLWEREAINESMNTMQSSGSVRMTKKIIKGTLLSELIASGILMFRFIPMLGISEGVYFSIFHSISAFCNAGFDLMGKWEPFSSISLFRDDILINIVIMSLIILGGLGFIVWDDVSRNKLKVKKYMLHTKLVLLASVLLIIGSAVLFYIYEHNNVLKDMSAGEAFLSTLFMAVTPRTGGFTTVDLAQMTDGGKLLTTILMFIGGSPGSTAGGTKTTTIVILVLAACALITSSHGVKVFGRRLEEEDIKKAATVFFINLFLGIASIMVMIAVQPLEFIDVCLEVFGAIGTGGMSTGITRELNTVSRIIIIILMYCGRMGSLSFVLIFTEKNKVSPIQNPKEKVLVG